MSVPLFSLLLISVFFMSCVDNNETGETELSYKLEIAEPDSKNAGKKGRIIKKSYSIGDSLLHTDLRNFRYFGSFFKGRASYFHNHTDTLSHGREVRGRDLLICFLDEQIARLKYKVDEDLSIILMKKYGSFKIRPLDSLSRTIVKTGKVLIVNDGQVGLNESIRSYELIWNKPDKQIVFKRSRSYDLVDSFEYEERIPDYKTAMVYLTKF